MIDYPNFNFEITHRDPDSRARLGRLTTPEDVAEVALFLCTGAAGMIHGQSIVVDGGYSIRA